MTSTFAALGIDEALRTLDMVKDGGSSLDIVMQITSKRAGDVQGESDRVYADSKPRLELMGYFFAAVSPTDPNSGSAAAKRQYSALRVVRGSDAATASMLKLLVGNDDITLSVSVFKAGGDAQIKDAKPLMRISLKAVRIQTYTLLAGSGGPIEIIDFAFRTLEIESAPQTHTGSRGALRTFADSLGE